MNTVPSTPASVRVCVLVQRTLWNNQDYSYIPH